MKRITDFAIRVLLQQLRPGYFELLEQCMPFEGIIKMI